MLAVTLVYARLVSNERFADTETNNDWTSLEARFHALDIFAFGNSVALADMGFLEAGSISALWWAMYFISFVREAALRNETTN